MNLSRIGSNQVSRIEGASLWVNGLRGAHLNELVTLVDGHGNRFVGRVTALHGSRTRIRLGDSLPHMDRYDLTVWLDTDEPDLPSGVPLWLEEGDRSFVPFRTGLPAMDVLFPLYRGDRVLLTASNQESGLATATSMLRSAIADGQTPVYVAIGAARPALSVLRRQWDELGLDESNLFAAPSSATAFRGLAPLRSGVIRAQKLAESGQPVCLILRDLDAWFELYQEKLTLRRAQRSFRGMLNAFHGMVIQVLDLTYRWRSRLTLVALLSDWQHRGCPSPLWGLRGYFDLAVPLAADGSVGLEGETSHWRDTPQRLEATWLRRQFKSLMAELASRETWGDDLPDELTAFRRRLVAFLARQSTPPGLTPSLLAWELLLDMPEDRLGRLPLSLLRERLSALRAERSGERS